MLNPSVSCFSLAYTGLADSYALIPLWGYRPKEYMHLAKQAALKAVELDDNSAAAHASLGYIIWLYDYDWVGAERELKRAIQLDSKYALAHKWYSQLHSAKGIHDKAIREGSEALKLEPFSFNFNLGMGVLLLNARRYENH